MDDFKARLKAAGFEPDEDSLKEMYAALPYLDGMRTRVGRDHHHEDDPAHIFSLLGPRS
ncbi:hypothetical protein [Bradyrhizobium sp. NAS80.1]|uniref:hypothetical protein n=1 Tax=Bradyrhizobium sp. NAS80.1 TaxID=1680159 RepID=UPI00143DF8AC|nr:hypothetical protein [Bradyrhizobium sp. NAS80.1]